MKLTPELIRAAGMDAGNAAMRKGGRTAWNEADANTAGERVAYLSVISGHIRPEDYTELGYGAFWRNP